MKLFVFHALMTFAVFTHHHHHNHVEPVHVYRVESRRLAAL
jgi:hypothetical protein